MKHDEMRRGWGYLLLFCVLLALPVLVRADDICIFGSTADDVPPNIILFLENGAEMEYIVPPSDLYRDSRDYNDSRVYAGFFTNDRGYGMDPGHDNYLKAVGSDLELNDSVSIQESAHGGIWSKNGRNLALPVSRSSSLVDGVKDNNNSAGFRYKKNYLNWLFYGPYAGDGSDLPQYSNFYVAKKAIFEVAKRTANRAKFGIYNFTANANGSSSVQPLKFVVSTLAADQANEWSLNTLDSAFVNNINNMSTVKYSPLAEGLAGIASYFGSPSSHVVGAYCQKNFVIVISPGLSSEDDNPAAQSIPGILSDYDNDSGVLSALGGEGYIKAVTGASVYSEKIPVIHNGTSYLDDVASYLFNHDVVDYQDGFQNVITYTVGFMSSPASRLFLINTSNNGNGNTNLYDTTDKEYGKYHFDAATPSGLSGQLMEAIIDILSRTSTFTAPVVPVTRTTSGSSIYLALFKPSTSNFWEGNVLKLGINSQVEIVDKNNDSATYANGALKEDIEAYWETKNWAYPSQSNYIHNANRHVYTYLGASSDLTVASNAFVASNPGLTAAALGSPRHTTAEIVNYLRGADVFDEDADGNTSENRDLITGDVLHSEPLVVSYNDTISYVFFGANDGMLHAVRDADGVNVWSFVLPDQLNRVKDIVEGVGHQYYVDSSPKVYIKDVNHNYIIEPANGDQVILVCGERKGGTSYFGLDITQPEHPYFLWRLAQAGAGGIMDLTAISGAFQDNEVLQVSNRYASVDGAPLLGPANGFLKFKGQTSNFAVGTTVRGVASGAAAGITAVDDFGDYGVLSLNNIVTGAGGSFLDNESLQVSTRYAAANGSAPVGYLYVRNGFGDFSKFMAGSVLTGNDSGATATVSAVYGVQADDPLRAVVGIENRIGNFSANEDLLVNNRVALANGTLFDFILFKNQQQVFPVGTRIRGDENHAQATVASFPVPNMIALSDYYIPPWRGGFMDNERFESQVVRATAIGTQFQYVRYKEKGTLPSSPGFSTNKTLYVSNDSNTVATANNFWVNATSTTSGQLIPVEGYTLVTAKTSDGKILISNAKNVAKVDGGPRWMLRYNQIQGFNVDDIIEGATSGAQAKVVSTAINGIIEIEPRVSWWVDPVTGLGSWALRNFQNGENLQVITPLATFDGTVKTQKGLKYDNSAIAFAVNDRVVGQTSGAVGVVAALHEPGVLEFVSVTGAFLDNEGLMVQKLAGSMLEQHNQALRYDDLSDAGMPFYFNQNIAGAVSGATAQVDGITEFVAGSTGILRIKNVVGVFQDNEDLLGGGIVTAAKADETPFDGLRYADLTADAFPTGIVIKGAVSNATAMVDQVTPVSGYTGILKLSAISGSFQDNEVLADNVALAAAQADGVLSGSILHFDNQTLYLGPGSRVTGATSGAGGTVVSVSVTPAPSQIIPELGESWAEPKFGLVKTTALANDSGTSVFFIGGGYSATNTSGKAIFAINTLTGAVVKKVKEGAGATGMSYSIPSSVSLVDEDGDNFTDKVYVGDMGGNVWRFGHFSAPFPNADEDITTWTAEPLFSESTHNGKFFYPPSVTLEKGYDLVFMGSGNRDDACDNASVDRIYAVKDNHLPPAKSELNLVNVLVSTPNLAGADQGYYVPLAVGEKVLGESLVFYKVAYFTTFTPSSEACTPGGVGRLYALEYKTGAAAIFDDRSIEIGGGIPSKPVLVIPPGDTAPEMFISVGTTNPDEASTSVEAGILRVDPDSPDRNFFYIWWRDPSVQSPP